MDIKLEQSTKKPNNNMTQAVISQDQLFILAKKINDFTDIVCPFNKVDEEKYLTKFFISINQLHRIHTLYEIVPELAKYTVSDNIISFDPIQKLPSDVFGNAEKGVVHYKSFVEKRKHKEVEVSVDPKLVLSNVESPAVQIKYNQNIKFKSNFLKAFPIILNRGFIFASFEKEVCELNLTIMNPSDGFVGDCSKFEVNNIIQFVLPLWDIFDINVSKNTRIFMRRDFLQVFPDSIKNIKTPIMINAKYNINNSSDIEIKITGEYVKLDN